MIETVLSGPRVAAPCRTIPQYFFTIPSPGNTNFEDFVHEVETSLTDNLGEDGFVFRVNGSNIIISVLDAVGLAYLKLRWGQNIATV